MRAFYSHCYFSFPVSSVQNTSGKYLLMLMFFFGPLLLSPIFNISVLFLNSVVVLQCIRDRKRVHVLHWLKTVVHFFWGKVKAIKRSRSFTLGTFHSEMLIFVRNGSLVHELTKYSIISSSLATIANQT